MFLFDACAWRGLSSRVGVVGSGLLGLSVACRGRRRHHGALTNTPVQSFYVLHGEWRGLLIWVVDCQDIIPTSKMYQNHSGVEFYIHVVINHPLKDFLAVVLSPRL